MISVKTISSIANRVINSVRFRGNRLIRNSLSKGLGPIPIKVWQSINSERLFGIFYHVVSDNNLPHVSTFKYKRPDEFRSDLIYLKDNFDLLTYEQLKDHVLNSRKLSRPSAFVTFDDGLRECIDVARDILLELEVPCMFFINTGFLDNEIMFYRHKAALCIDKIWSAEGSISNAVLDQVASELGIELENENRLWAWLYEATYKEEAKIEYICKIMDIDWKAYLQEKRPYLNKVDLPKLSGNGFTLGAHTREHKLLSLLADPNEIEREIVDSCNDIKDLTGQETVPFAFPFKGRGVDRNLLQRIYNDNQVVDLIFESRGLGLENSFIINRFWTDPPPKKRGTSNVEQLLKNEYIREIY